MSSKGLLVDAFTAFNEISLAEFRIKYLWDKVDFFVIAESSLTHSGLSKELLFEEWVSGHNEFRGKVVCIDVDLSDCGDAWEREIKQREELSKYLVRNYPESHFILSDLDEIPSLLQIEEFKERYMESYEGFKFPTPTSYRYGNFLRQDKRVWCKGIMGGAATIKLENAGRYHHLQHLKSEQQGIHFSYLKYEDNSVGTKLKSFAHEELNNPFLAAQDLIEYADKYLVDHIGTFNSSGWGLLHQQKEIELNELQCAALDFNSDWFDFTPRSQKKYQRLFASLVITAIRIQPRFSERIFKVFVSRDCDSSSTDVIESVVGILVVVGGVILHKSIQKMAAFRNYLFG
jgi:beta-1,4-mannosyl-glycoprotein beta-1,4-N-acetylglucosaminyltransferase